MPEPGGISSVEYRDFSRQVHERAALADRVIKAQLELTYRCNLHCGHCYTDPYNSRAYLPRELTLPEIMRLLDEMEELGILWLNLTGGEIFTHPRFFEVYDAAHRMGFLLQLYTNGTVFTEALIERLEAAPPFSIDISCHSVDEAAFDRFTQTPGSFQRFMKGMELLRASSLPFAFRTKLMNWNHGELPAIKRFVEGMGQRFGFTTSLSPRLNGDCSSLEYRIAPEELRALEESLVDDAAAAARRDESECGVEDATRERLYRCGCATNTIHVNAWGEVGTCTLQYERRASLREHSLKDAITRVFSEIRALRYHTASPCRTCELLALCDKKPTEARLERGSPEAPVPYHCDVAMNRSARRSPEALIHPLRPRQRVSARGGHRRA